MRPLYVIKTVKLVTDFCWVAGYGYIDLNERRNLMIIFDENTMLKSSFNTSFVVSGDDYGVAKVYDQEANEPEGEFADVKEGQECWVIGNIYTETYNDQAMMFVYIPEMDIATTVLSKFISI